MIDTLISFFSIWKNDPIVLGVLVGVIITLFNTLGSLVVFFVRGTVSQKILDLSLGFAAGLMLAACFTSLIIPGSKINGIFPVIFGIILGAVFLDIATHIIPHEHILKTKNNQSQIRSLWLFIMAITIHNMPEGLSVGIAMGSHHLKEAITLMLAIGIQNVPEGFSVSFSHYAQKLGTKWQSAWVGIKSGLVEIPLAVIGILLVSKITFILPYAMGFGAGAMLYVISNEIIPETHNKGFERIATTGTILGIIVMLALDMGLT